MGDQSVDSGVEAISAAGRCRRDDSPGRPDRSLHDHRRPGADTITGGTGADTINGGSGDDTITGGYGDDATDAGGGDDTINLANGDFVTGESIQGGAESGSGTRDQIVLTGTTSTSPTARSPASRRSRAATATTP